MKMDVTFLHAQGKHNSEILISRKILRTEVETNGHRSEGCTTKWAQHTPGSFLLSGFTYPNICSEEQRTHTGFPLHSHETKVVLFDQT